MWVEHITRLVVVAQVTAQRLRDDAGELSSQQVIWIAVLATLAITVGGIITNLVTSRANSLDLGG